MLNYPWSRHFQRYEYVMQKGYITNKTVLDIGCGTSYGTIAMSSIAKLAEGLDPEFEHMPPGVLLIPAKSKSVGVHKTTLEMLALNTKLKYDVCVAIEVFEHIMYPFNFIKDMASMGDYAFITTPLSNVTKNTRNKEHIAEYSSADFKTIISTRYRILKMVYQYPDLSIKNHGAYCGDSFDPRHRVQMAWCKRKK